MKDIFEFWSGLPGDAHVHPADQTVLDRVEHHFELDCLLGPFRGRLRTAPVVLLFLSPGFKESDRVHGQTKAGQEYYVRLRSGDCDLPTAEEHEAANTWATRIVRQFELDYDTIRSNVAFLNIGAYKSQDFRDWKMLTALPSCRITLDWTQSVLFPQAEAGERVVVCLRSAELWGLRINERYGKGLFAPACNRSGFMLKGQIREEAVTAVKDAIRLGRTSSG
jgi:hypothetical protein